MKPDPRDSVTNPESLRGARQVFTSAPGLRSVSAHLILGCLSLLEILHETMPDPLNFITEIKMTKILFLIRKLIGMFT